MYFFIFLLIIYVTFVTVFMKKMFGLEETNKNRFYLKNKQTLCHWSSCATHKHPVNAKWMGWLRSVQYEVLSRCTQLLSDLRVAFIYTAGDAGMSWRCSSLHRALETRNRATNLSRWLQICL